MGLFDHEARQFKFDVLREVSIHAYDGTLTEKFDDDKKLSLLQRSQETRESNEILKKFESIVCLY